MKQLFNYVLLYQWRLHCGEKALNLCEALEFSQTTIGRFIESNPESKLSGKENSKENIVQQVHVKRIKRAKLSSVIEEDSEGDLPFTLCSPAHIDP